MQTLLGGLLKNRHLVASMRRIMVMSLWEQVVGAVIAKKSWPEKVDNGVLIVGVTDHAWAEELNLRKAAIIARYRQLLGRSALKDLQFHLSQRKGHTAVAGDTPQSIVLHPTPADPLPSAAMPGDLLAGVSNPAVRDLLGPRFARLRAEREWKQEHGWAHCDECQRIFHGHTCPHCGGHPEAA